LQFGVNLIFGLGPGPKVDNVEGPLFQFNLFGFIDKKKLEKERVRITNFYLFFIIDNFYLGIESKFFELIANDIKRVLKEGVKLHGSI
jgi:hypothetical protein